MNGTVWPQSGWHYRRSLASRVILLTTMAVGLAVALVALAVFLTVRLQMQASLDESLLNRTKKAAANAPALSELIANQIPAFATGAADVRIIYVTGPAGLLLGRDDRHRSSGQPEYDVATGARKESIRTIKVGGEHYRVAAAPINDR